MRQQYDFSKTVRGNPYAARLRLQTRSREMDEDLPPLTPSQIREIRRRVRDAEDRSRYMLASVVAPRFVLYYNVEDDTYGFNEPHHATLFKRRAAAVVIGKILGGRIKVVRCRVNYHGKLVLRSLPASLSRRRPRVLGTT